MKLFRKVGEIGVFDIQMVDENQNKVATFLRSVNMHGYTMFIHFDVIDYEPLEFNTYPQALYGLKKVLNENGYVFDI